MVSMTVLNSVTNDLGTAKGAYEQVRHSIKSGSNHPSSHHCALEQRMHCTVLCCATESLLHVYKEYVIHQVVVQVRSARLQWACLL